VAICTFSITFKGYYLTAFVFPFYPRILSFPFHLCHINYFVLNIASKWIFAKSCFTVKKTKLPNFWGLYLTSKRDSMRLLFSIFLILACYTANCQQFTVNEMIALAKGDNNDFDTEVTKKKFIKAEDGATLTYYAHSLNAVVRIGYGYDQTELVKSVVYTFYSSEEYLKFKESLESSGFTFSHDKRPEMLDKALMLVYNNDDYMCAVISTPVKSGVQYIISVFKKAR